MLIVKTYYLQVTWFSYAVTFVAGLRVAVGETDSGKT